MRCSARRARGAAGGARCGFGHSVGWTRRIGTTHALGERRGRRRRRVARCRLRSAWGGGRRSSVERSCRLGRRVRTQRECDDQRQNHGKRRRTQHPAQRYRGTLRVRSFAHGRYAVACAIDEDRYGGRAAAIRALAALSFIRRRRRRAMRDPVCGRLYFAACQGFTMRRHATQVEAILLDFVRNGVEVGVDLKFRWYADAGTD